MNLGRALEAWTPHLVALDGVDRAVVACSGGPDSLALLALARACDVDAVAVYVDHGLHPGTQHEREIVEGAADRLGASFRLERVLVGTGPNLEARAREARYAALERARAGYDAGAVLVGHTRDDQAETMLLNLLRGSAAAGLAGMRTVRGNVRRPLLTLRRAQTREICARLGLVPADDPMNRDAAYRRVWLRREVVPVLERGARRDLVDVLARQADLLRDDDDLLDTLARERVDVSQDSLPVDEVVALPAPLARRVLRQWLGSSPPSAAHLDAVLATARGERRAAQLPGHLRVERSGGRLHVARATRDALEPVELGVPGLVAFGDWTIEAWVEHGPPAGWPDGRSTAVLDADRVGDRVAVRGPAAGDRFRPVGSLGSKLVHDALAEVGVPPSARSSQPVVTDTNGSVLWVVGYRIDDRVRVTYDTRRYLWVTSERA